MNHVSVSRLPLAFAIALALIPLAHADDAADANAGDDERSAVQLDAINVQGERDATSTNLGGFGDAPLLETPSTVTVVDRDQLDDRISRSISEVLHANASVGDSYAPIGYYQNFTIRGYSLNAANSYRINGLSIAGEQSVALENKQQVQVLNGLAGLQSGVNEPAGLIDYITKRPDEVRSLTLGTDDEGGRYYALDAGHWFGAEQQLGLRVNAAHEDMRSYVDHADGRRNFLSLAADWKISPKSLLQLDVEYQDTAQRSVPGYQLLGGDSVPQNVSVHRLLGYQPWARPVGMESLNSQLRWQYQFNDDWKASVAGSHSRSLINDYSVFPWGCYGAASCANDEIPNYFGSDGAYDISDYRNPADTRRHDALQASVDGRFQTGNVQHQLSVGADWLYRTVDRHGSINEWIGEGYIDADPPLLAPADGAELGPKVRRYQSTQKSLRASDRITFNDAWELLAGARWVHYDERVREDDGSLTRRTRRSLLLPQAALMFKPVENLSLYASYAKGLSAGTTAAWYTSNADEVMPTTTSFQRELGAKYQLGNLLLGAALFDISQAYQYTQPQADGSLLYVQQGRQHNRGLELSASGDVAQRLHLQASIAALHARVEDSGTASYEGHASINAPRWRGNVQAAWDVPGVEGLALLGGVQSSGGKFADHTGRIKVGGYTLYNLGARYATHLGNWPTTLRLSVENLGNKLYWRDVGESAGDGYLYLGAPRTARLSARFDF